VFSKRICATWKAWLDLGDAPQGSQPQVCFSFGEPFSWQLVSWAFETMRPPDPLVLLPSLTTHSAESCELPSLEEIFRRYSSYVAAIGWSLLGNDEDVDDLVQDVFLIAARRLKTIRDPAAIKGWLATTAVRAAMRKFRARRWLRLFRREQPHREESGYSGSASDRVLLAEVHRILERFPAQQRAAWLLRRIQGERLDEVARLCECSLATAKRRIDEVDAWLKEVFA